jgi:hypothetical protein
MNNNCFLHNLFVKHFAKIGTRLKINLFVKTLSWLAIKKGASILLEDLSENWPIRFNALD